MCKRLWVITIFICCFWIAGCTSFRDFNADGKPADLELRISVKGSNLIYTVTNHSSFPVRFNTANFYNSSYNFWLNVTDTNGKRIYYGPNGFIDMDEEYITTKRKFYRIIRPHKSFHTKFKTQRAYEMPDGISKYYCVALNYEFYSDRDSASRILGDSECVDFILRNHVWTGKMKSDSIKVSGKIINNTIQHKFIYSSK